jgi:hypothetical protein
VQSCARTDVVELQKTRNDKDSLELVVDKIKLETKEEKQHIDNLEKKLKELFTRIPNNTQATMSNAEE